MFARPTSNIQKCFVVVKLMGINFRYFWTFSMFFRSFFDLFSMFSFYVLPFYIMSFLYFCFSMFCRSMFCHRPYYCVYSPSMHDVVDASKQDDYLHKYRILLLFNCTLFFLSPMCASCLVRNHVKLYPNNRLVKALARLRISARSSEPSLWTDLWCTCMTIEQNWVLFILW